MKIQNTSKNHFATLNATFTRNTIALLSICLATSAGAQSLSPSVISSAGDSDHTDDITLEWTIGELAVATYYADGRMLTEGFHQPLLNVEKIFPPGNDEQDEIVVTIAPNPVKYTLGVEIVDPQKRLLELQLFDAQGRLVEHTKMDAQTQNLEFDMSNFASGFYVLRIIDPTSQTLLEAYKVAKIN